MLGTFVTLLFAFQNQSFIAHYYRIWSLYTLIYERISSLTFSVFCTHCDRTGTFTAILCRMKSLFAFRAHFYTLSTPTSSTFYSLTFHHYFTSTPYSFRTPTISLLNSHRYPTDAASPYIRAHSRIVAAFRDTHSSSPPWLPCWQARSIILQHQHPFHRPYR